MASKAIGKQAVVIGAGIGGLTAAGALAAHFEQVTVLERDALPSAPAHRPGIPQGRHLHVLLVSGLRALDELLPGFETELARLGAVPLKIGLDVRLERLPFDPFPQRDLGYVGYAASRPTIEYAARRQAGTLPNVKMRQLCRVRELLASPDGTTVTGVRYDSEDVTETLDADLVVDASGRGAPTLGLLQSIGKPPPEVTTIGIDLGYSTCIFDRSKDVPRDWKAVFTFPNAPQDSRGGVLFPVEGDRWMVTLVGSHGVILPHDEEGVLTYCRQLRTPTIYDRIKGAKCLAEVARYHFPESALRHFERLENFPHRLVLIGDAICQFNPTLAQGMSVAAQEACLLRRQLDNLAREQRPITELGRALFPEIAAWLEEPWSVAMQDFVFPQTRGQRPADLAARLKFGAALSRLAAEDAAVHKLTTEVQHLLKPRSVYRDPTLTQRVMAMMAQAQA